MVDVMPWGGDYSGTVVRNNTIIGGYLRSSTPVRRRYCERCHSQVSYFSDECNNY
jgi:hypothetical protein